MKASYLICYSIYTFGSVKKWPNDNCKSYQSLLLSITILRKAYMQRTRRHTSLIMHHYLDFPAVENRLLSLLSSSEYNSMGRSCFKCANTDAYCPHGLASDVLSNFWTVTAKWRINTFLQYVHKSCEKQVLFKIRSKVSNTAHIFRSYKE